MDLENLKTDWNKINYSSKTDKELEKMTTIKNHPVLKKIRLKLMIETIAISIFLMIYYSGFDGDKKPVYANILLILACFSYIINGLLSFRAIQKPICGENLKKSIHSYFNRIKKISRISMGITALYSCSLLLFFSSTINFTKEKKWILLFCIIIAIQSFFWSYRIWTSWLEKLKIQTENLEG